MDEPDPLYPEHEKLAKIKDSTQAIGEFLEWTSAKGWMFGEYPYGFGEAVMIDGNEVGTHIPVMLPVKGNKDDWLAEWAGIDQFVLEEEKRLMLNRQRVMNRINRQVDS